MLRRMIWVVAITTLCLTSAMVEESPRASEMGFRFNKGICRQFPPVPRGFNWVSLPASNNYITSLDVCRALSFSGPERVLQINADTGVVFAGPCNSPLSFTLVPLVGVTVDSVGTDTSGVIEGSHPPGTTYVLFEQDGPPNNGRNLYPVPYHSMAATSADLCLELGLVGNTSQTGARIRYANGCGNGIILVDDCFGPGGSFPLPLGDSVMIEQLSVRIPSFSPRHF